jgi:hypothetical protein
LVLDLYELLSQRDVVVSGDLGADIVIGRSTRGGHDQISSIMTSMVGVVRAVFQDGGDRQPDASGPSLEKVINSSFLLWMIAGRAGAQGTTFAPKVHACWVANMLKALERWRF